MESTSNTSRYCTGITLLQSERPTKLQDKMPRNMWNTFCYPVLLEKWNLKESETLSKTSVQGSSSWGGAPGILAAGGYVAKALLDQGQARLKAENSPKNKSNPPSPFPISPFSHLPKAVKTKHRCSLHVLKELFFYFKRHSCHQRAHTYHSWH